jgi:hypothetical protein
MAKSNERSTHGPDTEAQDQPLHHSHSACNTRPVHTVGSKADMVPVNCDVGFTLESGHSLSPFQYLLLCRLCCRSRRNGSARVAQEAEGVSGRLIK